MKNFYSEPTISVAEVISKNILAVSDRLPEDVFNF